MPTRNPQTDVTPVSFLVAPSSDLLGYSDQWLRRSMSSIASRRQRVFKKIDRKELCEFQASKWSSITQFFFRIKKRIAHIVWERNLHRNHTKGPKSHGPRVYFEIRCMIVDPSLGGWQLEFIDVHFLEPIQTWSPTCSPTWQEDTVEDWEQVDGGWWPEDSGGWFARRSSSSQNLSLTVWSRSSGNTARVRFCKMLGARANAVREVPGCVVTRWPEAYRSFGHPRQLLFRYIPVWESASTEFLVDKIHQIPTPLTFELPKFVHIFTCNEHESSLWVLSGPAGNSTRSSVSSNDKECSTWRSQEVNQGCSTWCSMLSSDGEIQWFQWLVIGWDVRNLNSCDRRNPSKSPTCRGLGCVAKTCSTRNGPEVCWSTAGFMRHKLSSRLAREKTLKERQPPFAHLIPVLFQALHGLRATLQLLLHSVGVDFGLSRRDLQSVSYVSYRLLLQGGYQT